MMSEEQKQFLNNLQKRLISVAIGYLFVIIGLGIAFYFNTNHFIEDTEKSTLENKDKIEKIHKVIQSKASKDEVYIIKDDLKDYMETIRDDIKYIKDKL